jgi:hypothetical protein
MATIEDTTSLTKAFQGAEAVFVLVPPNFDPLPGFPEARTTEQRCDPRSTLRVLRKSFLFPRLEHRPTSLTC